MPPNKSFGIDHPLIAVNDIYAIRKRLQSLGFTMTPVGKHPWGTSTSLAMFKNCLLEVMGVYDHSLQDEKPTGDFKFGRHVIQNLRQREGIALTALHSENSKIDATTAISANWQLSGHLEFGRNVTLPDGRLERTKTTLALLPDSSYPRLSFFLCQQHRRDLIEVPEWMTHPNSTFGILGISIKAPINTHVDLKQKLENIYGPSTSIIDGFMLETPNGYIRVQNNDALIDAIGRLPHSVVADNEPAIVAMEFKAEDLSAIKQFSTDARLASHSIGNQLTLTDASLFGNTLMQFRKCTPN